MNDIEKDRSVLESIARRAHYLATQMIFLANHRKDKAKGDPKVGGHPSACASALHIMGALHLVVKTGFDQLVNKPHASPTDHAYNYLLNQFLKDDFSRLSRDEMNQAMHGLRAFSQNGEPVFQSYHSAYDPDRHNFLPSGTVGIPQVNLGYLALAYLFASDHGWSVPDTHFWAVMGDSEFREGSVFESMPDLAERELGNLTWILDYNRQSLDGHRITNKEVMDGTDDTRIERTARANGWDVIQVRHGSLREALFKKPGGQEFKRFLEDDLEDYELQALLLVHDMKALKQGMSKAHPNLKTFLKEVSDEELLNGISDLGGHDIVHLANAMNESKKNRKKPTLIIAHTLKGWGLRCEAMQGNHNMVPTQDEVDELREKQGISKDILFEGFDSSCPEGKFLNSRGESLYKTTLEQEKLRESNAQILKQKLQEFGEIPETLDINLKMASYPHTQWMLGQLTAKLTRISNTSLNESKIKKGEKVLTDFEKSWRTAGDTLVTMAPDVGTSTNLNPAMDSKIFGAPIVRDYETDLGVKDSKLPDLVPGLDSSDRFIRFEITEANTMSCMGSFGRMRDILGIPLLPLMTVYDFFVKRALDQFFYDLYWKSSFILVGTPAGVSLSPEGAQHGWKSDFQIPNQIVWEPFYCVELDWILCDAIKRHYVNNNEGRSGVHIRGTTVGVEQKDLIIRLRQQKRFKQNFDQGQVLCSKDLVIDGAVVETEVPPKDDDVIMANLRSDVLAGGYYLIDFRGYASYEPGDNVVNIFSLGPLGTEAIKASDELLKRGIYANVIMVTSPDLLLGNLAHDNNYFHLKEKLGVNGDLHLEPTLNGKLTMPEVVTLSGRRIPIVSVHDGEPGLLDNIGSIIGTRHESLAVRKHSKCGRPKDVYRFHNIDADSIIDTVGKALSETALEQIRVSKSVLEQVQGKSQPPVDWRSLWPETKH